MNKMLTKSKAFTLIEVLVVIVLLGVLTVSQVPKVANQFDKPKDLAVTRDFQKYIDAAKLTHTQGKDITKYEYLNQELVPELRINDSNKSETNNPYGNPYLYSTPPELDKGFKITSTGSKEERTIKVKIGDDNKLIVTWTPEVNGTGLGTGGNNTTPPTPVDKSQLEQVIQQVEQDLDKYTPSSKDIIESLLNEAKNTNNNPDVTQSEVDDIIDRLQDALNNGVISADKSQLEQVIQQTEQDLDDYTQSSKDEIKQLIDEAKNTNNNPDATQSEVDDITDRLNDALNNGVKYNVDNFYTYTPETISGVEGYKVGLTAEFKTYLDSNDTSTDYRGFTNRQPLPNPGSIYNSKPVISMNRMFYYSKATSLDLSSFDTSNVTDMKSMFYYSQATTLDLSSFNTSNVTDMGWMFYNSKATSIDLSNFDTGNVTGMSYMFFNSQITTLVLSSFNTSKVTSMTGMFAGSKTIIIDLSSFDTSNVTNMSSMFWESQATSLDLSSFDTSKVTNMTEMFRESQATTLNLSSFNTSNVTNMYSMFQGSQATTLDLSNFDTSKVTNMYNMFCNSQATTLNLSSFNTSNVTDMNSMFSGSKATTLNLSSFDTSKVTDTSYMFLNSKATTGYARTTPDATKFNAALTFKPSNLTFKVGKP